MFYQSLGYDFTQFYAMQITIMILADLIMGLFVFKRKREWIWWFIAYCAHTINIYALGFLVEQQMLVGLFSAVAITLFTIAGYKVYQAEMKTIKNMIPKKKEIGNTLLQTVVVQQFSVILAFVLYSYILTLMIKIYKKKKSPTILMFIFNILLMLMNTVIISLMIFITNTDFINMGINGRTIVVCFFLLKMN